MLGRAVQWSLSRSSRGDPVRQRSEAHVQRRGAFGSSRREPESCRPDAIRSPALTAHVVGGNVSRMPANTDYRLSVNPTPEHPVLRTEPAPMIRGRERLARELAGPQGKRQGKPDRESCLANVVNGPSIPPLST